MIQFDGHIFQMGWFNHQRDMVSMNRWIIRFLSFCWILLHVVGFQRSYRRFFPQVVGARWRPAAVLDDSARMGRETDIRHIITQLAIYKWSILPIGGLYGNPGLSGHYWYGNQKQLLMIPSRSSTASLPLFKVHRNPIRTPDRLPTITLPETDGSHLKIGLPKRKLILQPSIFRCYVFFKEGIFRGLSLLNFGGGTLDRPPTLNTRWEIEPSGWHGVWKSAWTGVMSDLKSSLWSHIVGFSLARKKRHPWLFYTDLYYPILGGFE